MLLSTLHRNRLPIACAIALTAAILPRDAQAQSVEEHFRGKQIRLLIGSSAGGGYDLFARTIATYWPKHIPGNPGMVPQNVPGALSLQVAINIFAVAPKDGTVIGAVNPLIVPRAVLNVGGARFDARQFTWIGSALREYQIAVARSDAPVKTFDDVFKTELIVGGSGGATDQFPLVTNAVLGTKFKVVSGYPGTREVNLALDRNEVQGNGAITWASIKSTMTAMLAEKRINLIVQFGLKVHPELPQVPYALSYAKAAEQRDALMLLFAVQEFGRPYIAPPGLPAPVAAALRQSFSATMADPAFLDEAKRRGLDIDPTPGDEIDALVRRLYETPSPTVQRVRAIFASQGK
jgi:tripartite-type tricarboxylate transporter receptor subunit TctC